jgi:hypothetical protein
MKKKIWKRYEESDMEKTKTKTKRRSTICDEGDMKKVKAKI